VQNLRVPDPVASIKSVTGSHAKQIINLSVAGKAMVSQQEKHGNAYGLHFFVCRTTSLLPLTGMLLLPVLMMSTSMEVHSWASSLGYVQTVSESVTTRETGTPMDFIFYVALTAHWY
jgi:hypothetical protein